MIGFAKKRKIEQRNKGRQPGLSTIGSNTEIHIGGVTSAKVENSTPLRCRAPRLPFVSADWGYRRSSVSDGSTGKTNYRKFDFHIDLSRAVL